MSAKVVVVVEDDPMVMQIAVAVLEEAEIPVVSFANADDALAYMFEHAADVAAIFSDLQMPGRMDGLVLAEVIGRQWPKVVVLLTSGRVTPMGALPANVRFLPKPWSPNQVVTEFRRAIGMQAAPITI